jgi:hypothetical protein
MQVTYGKPKDWFDFVNTVEKLGCPSDDEIERIAEMKATRDVFEHNASIVNKTYLAKAGAKARFKEGDPVEVPDLYLQDCWAVLKKVSGDVVAALIKIRAANKPVRQRLRTTPTSLKHACAAASVVSCYRFFTHAATSSITSFDTCPALS